LHFYLGQDAKPVAASADEFVAYVAKLLADTVTVHHGHMPEIELTSATTATGIWAMFDGCISGTERSLSRNSRL
jgi:hypothetical protein